MLINGSIEERLQEAHEETWAFFLHFLNVCLSFCVDEVLSGFYMSV